MIFSKEGRGPDQVFCEALPTVNILRINGLFPGIEVETAVVPTQKLAHLLLADELFPAQGGQKIV
jgi:hypothetical protein